MPPAGNTGAPPAGGGAQVSHPGLLAAAGLPPRVGHGPPPPRTGALLAQPPRAMRLQPQPAITPDMAAMPVGGSWLSARQVETAWPVPGFTASREREQFGAAAKAPYGHALTPPADKSSAELADEARQQASAIVQRLTASALPSENDRPATSAARRLVSSLGVFSPRPMADLTSCEKTDAARRQIAAGVPGGISTLSHWTQADKAIRSSTEGDRLAARLRGAAQSVAQAGQTGDQGEASAALAALNTALSLRDLCAAARTQTAAAGAAGEAVADLEQRIASLGLAIGMPGLAARRPGAAWLAGLRDEARSELARATAGAGGDAAATRHAAASAVARAAAALERHDARVADAPAGAGFAAGGPTERERLVARRAAAQKRLDGFESVQLREQVLAAMVACAQALEVARPAAREARRIQDHTDAQLMTAEHALAATMTTHPPGFAVAQTSAELRAAFGRLRDVLPDPSPQRAISRSGWMEIASRAIAQATDGDAARATRVLDALMGSRLEDWIPRPGESEPTLTPDAQVLHRDMATLFRLAADTPRALEALALATPSRRGSAPSLAYDGTLHVRNYWRADAAHAALPADDPVSGPWLDGARRAASRAVHEGAAAIEGVPQTRREMAEVGALRAVQQGFVSCAPGSPYDECNRLFSRMLDDWTSAAGAADDGGVRERLKAFGPQRRTPFRARSVALAELAGRGMGLATHGVAADRTLHAALRAMGSEASAELDTALRSGRPDAATLGMLVAEEALIALLANRPLDHLASEKLGPRVLSRDAGRATTLQLSSADRRTLAAAIGTRLHQIPDDARAEVRTAAFAHCRAFVHALAEQPAQQPTALGGARWIDAQAGAGAGPDGARRARRHEPLLSRAAGSLAAAEPKPLDSRQALIEFIEPLLSGVDLRDKIRLGGGGIAGAGVAGTSFLKSIVGIAPILAAWRRDDASFEIAHPMTGLQVTIAGQVQIGAEVGVAAGPNIGLHKKVKLGLTGSLKHAQTGTDTIGVTLRIRRRAGDLDGMREDMKNVLSDLAQWEDLGARDPLEAMLSRNPRLIVADFRQLSHGGQTELKAEAALRIPLPVAGKRLKSSAQFSPHAELVASNERQYQLHVENPGEAGAFIERISHAQQKLKIGGGLLGRVGGAGKTGRAEMSMRAPLPLEATRVIANRFERHGFTGLMLSGTMDADHDRYYDTAKELLADIAAHRERWILRAMETLPAGWSPTQKRQFSNEMLERFEADARHLEQTSDFGAFNIHYTMRPEAAPQFELLAALEALASDDAQAQRIRIDRETLLHDGSTWRPSTLNLIPRARESEHRGVNFLLRWGNTYSADAQTQLTEFPPRFTPADAR